ncbi:hypothetical protein [Agromyces neolithicus]|uniref:AbiEi antitoxin C-terminal domain-containing protein n=1 Tax=Agromyces neolithicus TaxID=269420 RepID=A0ABN2M5Z4_9MICO
MTDLPILENGLILTADVRAAGLENVLSAAAGRGEFERIRRGVWAQTVPGSWRTEPERGELKYRRAVLAASLTLKRPVFTSFAGLALRRLPIFGRWPSDIYVLSRDAQGRKRAGLISVSGSYVPDVETVDGIATTSIEFTLIQVCRHGTLAAALTAVDAALHRPRFGDTQPKTTIERLRAEHERLLPYRGSRRTDAVLARATALADTPLETVSRLVIEELGFEAPELQHELWLPELGKRAFLDFWWPSVGAAAEADGKGKYRGGVPEAGGGAAQPMSRAESGGSRAVVMATGGTTVAGAAEIGPKTRAARAATEAMRAAAVAAKAAADAVISEKERENAIRRQVRAFDRWGWGETMQKTPVERRLTAMKVPRPKRRRLLVGSPDAPAALPSARRRSHGSKVRRPEQGS